MEGIFRWMDRFGPTVFEVLVTSQSCRFVVTVHWQTGHLTFVLLVGVLLMLTLVSHVPCCEVQPSPTT